MNRSYLRQSLPVVAFTFFSVIGAMLCPVYASEEDDAGTMRKGVFLNPVMGGDYPDPAQPRWEDMEKESFGMEMSGYNHNTLGDFQSVFPGLFSYGDGSVRFTDFRYETLLC